MNELSNRERSIELLQQLGLKEYESKCFVALSRLPKGTAKEVSELSDVPRTRVYDAIRVLEAKGFVEVQHSNPQQFRAVPIDEAAETLRREYETRTETLVEALEGVERVTPDDDAEATHEVWALSESTAITNRTRRLVDEAEREVVLVVGCEEVVTEKLLDRLRSAGESGVSVIVGALNEELRDRIRNALPDAEVFVSGLEWLSGSGDERIEGTTITRLLLADRNAILVSSRRQGNPTVTEQAVFGGGFSNGIVIVARRLMATGLGPTDDPEIPDA